MSTAEQRRQIAETILDFEARRDKQGHLKVYKLPVDDHGGTFEVAGINDRYHPYEARLLASLIEDGRYDEAEEQAIEITAMYTDVVVTWSGVVAVECYLRDCAFNRGPSGAACILQRALGVDTDGVVGRHTRAALAEQEKNAAVLLQNMRAAREDYERTVAHRDETSKFWKGLVRRWDKALEFARGFLAVRSTEAVFDAAACGRGQTMAAVPVPMAADDFAPPSDIPVIIPALRIGNRGGNVRAWQSFLAGQGFDPGEPDGLFCDRTLAATIAFQQHHSLLPDGIAGRQTLMKAMALGFELIEEPAQDTSGSNFPPRPNFAPLVGIRARQSVFGAFDFRPDPLPGNKENIKILDNWDSANIVSVPIPQLRKALGNHAPATSMRFHRLAAAQLIGLWQEWEQANLLDRIQSYDGAFCPRFIRGSTTTLSNHAFGSAFDINLEFNGLGKRPALVGQQGCVRELVPIAHKWGFYWGGHFSGRPDGMHFEIAFIT